MRFRTEIEPGCEKEIILRIPEPDEEAGRIRDAIAQVLATAGEIAVSDEEKEVYIKTADFLFFETWDGKVLGHTKDNEYTCRMRLFELEERLPRTFVRASKACIVNTAKIQSLSRSLTGVTDVGFHGSDKTVTVSRMYYHPVRDMIEETRLIK